MRVFIAVDAPDFSRLAQRFAGPGIKTVDAFHITLKFLGDIQQDELEALKKRLSSVKFKPFSLKTAQIGHFPHDRRPNVVWIGVESPQLIELQRQIDGALAGLYKSEHNFVPHITIARAKSQVGRDALAACKENIATKEWMVTSFKLYESKLTDYGPEYRLIKSFA